jgi:glycerol-3-phosphate dehydrogenase
MPICSGIHRALYENVAPLEVVRDLMGRPIRSEFD